MKMLHISALITLTTTLLCATSQQEQAELIKTGKESTALLLKTLGTNMQQHMKAGGPMDALDFCSNEAYSLTESVNKKLQEGVTVKRVSSKFRSLVNKPSTDEQKVLEKLQAQQDAGEKLPPYVLKQVNQNSYKFYKPLIIEKEVCLKCHGNVTDKHLKDAIEARYPDDKAMHYKLNDLRGAVVVTITK
ncbi:MAG: DUF3365 domain-containing protein [Campylobacterales bacterium]|nr:DUF3365 domain-containing protein [Campylobacterales bacterium]